MGASRLFFCQAIVFFHIFFVVIVAKVVKLDVGGVDSAEGPELVLGKFIMVHND